MYLRLGQFVTRHWLAVLAGWTLLLLALSTWAPAWDDVTEDGDFAYLPPQSTSLQAERLLEQAFTRQRSKSHVAVVISRADAPLTEPDLEGPAYDVARRLENCFAVAQYEHALALRAGASTDGEDREQRVRELLESAEERLSEAIELDGIWAARAARVEAEVARATGKELDEEHAPRRMGLLYHNRALVSEALGRKDEADLDRELAWDLAPELRGQGALPEEARTLPALDVWTWRDEIFGEKLRSVDGHARLVVLHLTREFLEVGNIGLLQFIERELGAVRAAMARQGLDHLEIGIGGSAAVGGDLLRAAKASIDHTELFTVVLVVGVLAVVYRSPLLVVVPLITIFFSLRVSMGVVALLTKVGAVPGLDWMQVRVFSTSKIFIVVILFGAGTDFCLFLIARCREQLRRVAASGGDSRAPAVAEALGGVGDALAASALTTVLGLAMMAFADYGKFQHSGPVIGLCLLITLAACLTLTPALLHAFEPLVARTARGGGGDSRVWGWLADRIVRHPSRVLLGTAIVLAPLAWLGLLRADDVTYDFLASLDRTAPSRQGAELMRRSFPVGEGSPLTIVAHRPGAAFGTPDGSDHIAELNGVLHGIAGVDSVRSLADPLGECEPGEAASLFSTAAWRARFARPHPRTAELFLSQAGGLAGEVTRFDLLLAYDPFSLDAIQVMERVDGELRRLAESEGSYWRGAQFMFAGTTAGIRDLARVTHGDTQRIEVLVVLAVLAVLVLILRRLVVSLYLVLSVLLTYYVTVGASTLVFAAWYGVDYHGLDWKVPLFLFVILVAVGQDYNVYLVTRVFEEQAKIGRRPGLREAVIRTGGIISSCGLIMACTFASMTSSVWVGALAGAPGFGWLPQAPSLQGTTQLGFALALGVALDTFVVRPILVPAFLAWRPGKEG